MRRHFAPAGVGRWSMKHPWLAVVVWLVFVVATVGALAVTGSKQLHGGSAGESARADALMQKYQIAPSQPEYAYLHSSSLVVGDAGFRAAIAQTAARLHRAVGGTVTTHLSADRHSALLAGVIARPFSTDVLAASVSSVAKTHPQLSATLDDSGVGGNSDLQRAERLSVPVTLLVLLIAFGAIVAALVPVLLAVTAVVAAFGLLGPISQIFPLDSSVKTVVLLIGMAVGVDYALFYVIRSREERRGGLTSHEALERTARTSGRTVLIAGTTVMLAMAGQFAIGSGIFNGIAAGTIAVIACAVAGSVTVLPAVLELLGPRIDRGRIPFLPHLGADDTDSRFWPAVVDRVLRRPVVSLLSSVGLLVALALPATSMHVAFPSTNGTASSQADLAAQVSAAFPATSSPAIIVLTSPAADRPAVGKALQRLEARAADSGLTHPPFTLTAGRDGRAATLALPLTGLGDNAASKHAISLLRQTWIPQTIGRVTGVQTAVTGDTARDIDFTSQMTQGLPYVIGFVLILGFLLLLVTFRSLVIPVKAITLNLLSVAASYGVLVLVFQHRWAQGVLGFHSTGAIISWLPLFLFVVLFGLSMDYHIFILSRVREGIDHGLTNDEALRYGITRTAGVVTSAALVMFGVFSLFATATALNLKQAGVGLAVAVLLDATVIRAVLLPASMKLLGDWNWYLPRWLEWLPRTHPKVAEQKIPSATAHPPATTPAPAEGRT